MVFINVAEWSPQNVVNWLQGLEDSIRPYAAFFLNRNINGCRLLLLSSDDLINLNVTKVGHQEIILEAVEHLKQLHYNFCSETLQMLALRLGCKARSLFNSLKQETVDESTTKLSDRVTTRTLSGVCDILTSVKLFVSWIDRYPFSGVDEYISMRRRILKLSIELASTAQRDQFVEKPNEVIKENCLTFAEMCDKIVQELNDPLAIQPESCEVITIKRRSEEDLFWGLHVSPSFLGYHLVEKVDHGCPFQRGRIDEGSEIVQINYQTVVGWQVEKIFNIVKDYAIEVSVTIKKRPCHSNNRTPERKPIKTSNRKVKSSLIRFRNASTATTNSLNSDYDSDQGSFKEGSSHSKSSTSQSLLRRTRGVARSRSSLSKSSPTTLIAPVQIEDFYERRKMVYPRTSESKQSITFTSTKPNQYSSLKPKVPYAKVHPLLSHSASYGSIADQNNLSKSSPPLPLRPKPLTPRSSPPPVPTPPSSPPSSSQLQNLLRVNQSRPIQQVASNPDLEDNPEYHEYQPPPSPKPLPPPVPLEIKQRILEARAVLNSVTLPRRRSNEARAIELVDRLSTFATLKQEPKGSSQSAPQTPSPVPPPIVPRKSICKVVSATIKAPPLPPPRVPGLTRSTSSFKGSTSETPSPSPSDSKRFSYTNMQRSINSI